MNYLIVQNHQVFDIKSIPILSIPEFENSTLDLLKNGSRMISYCPINKMNKNIIVAILSDKNTSSFYLLGCNFEESEYKINSFA
nr:hypothetical protein [Melioribacteraceae bacterium]